METENTTPKTAYRFDSTPPPPETKKILVWSTLKECWFPAVRLRTGRTPVWAWVERSNSLDHKEANPIWWIDSPKCDLPSNPY